MSYTPVPGFEELQAEFHEAIPHLVNGEPDKSDFMVPLRSIVEWWVTPGPLKRYSMREVAEAVMAEAGVNWETLTSPRRATAIVRPRQLAMYLMRELCPHVSMPQIARFLNKSDHTTVICAVERSEKLIGIDPEFRRFYEATLYRLGARYKPM